MGSKLIITCEHAGNEVPREYRHLFEHDSGTLQTHRGIDIGALELTNTVAQKMQQEPYLHTVTRLLVDLNRSVQSPTLFSEFTRDEPLSVREDIFENYYWPHRKKVEQRVKQIIREGDRAVHVGIHTFTPVWEGEPRDVDVGFLYDPTRDGEQEFCQLWRNELAHRNQQLRLRMNQPYRGTMDGFTTYLRRNFSRDDYLGMEIEVSQRFADTVPEAEWEQLQRSVANSLHAAFEFFRK